MAKMYIVKQEYQNSNTDPIELKSGDLVSIGEEFKDNSMWPNWVNCVSKKTNKNGWTPIQILQINGSTGIALCDYSAKEMTVAVNDVVSGFKEMNGWIWCIREADKENGWVPASCLERV